MLKQLCLLSALTLFSPLALAEDSLETLMAPENTSLTEAPAAESTEPSKFSVGAGTGVSFPTGNIGKLYSSSSPLLDLRMEYRFNPILGARAGMMRGSFDFNAEPNGAVEVSLTSLNLAAVIHPMGVAQKGFDPYLIAGVSQVFRSQAFQTLNDVQKDNAFAAELGAGSTYFLVPGKAALWLEARGSQIFFRDRYESTYLQSGLADTTGMLFSTGAGMQYYF